MGCAPSYFCAGGVTWETIDGFLRSLSLLPKSYF